MNQTITPVLAGFAVTLMTGLLLISTIASAEDKAASPLEQGKQLAIEFCQACHYFEGTNQAGTTGPPLLAMKPRFPVRQKLERIIHDPQVATKPDTMMPPFGRNGLLDEQQIKLIIDFLYTL